MSKLIQFKVSDDEYQDILKSTKGKSANLLAKKVFLESFYSEYEMKHLVDNLLDINKRTFNCSLAIYSIFNQYIDQTLSADQASKIMEEALKQEEELKGIISNDSS